MAASFFHLPRSHHNMVTLVLVCGWIAAKPRTVDKYAAVHQALGYETLTLLATPFEFFTPEASVHTKSFEAFKAWRQRFPADEPLHIVPHIFSNGGARTWYCFENHLVRAGMPFHVPGMIIDSALTKPYDHKTGPAAFAASVKNPVLRQLLTGLLILVFFVLKWVLIACGQGSPIELHFQRFIERDTAIPKLFLYSTADKMIPASQVEYAIETAQALQTPVTAVNFEDSMHVAHLTKHPERYAQSVETFLAKVAPQTKRPAAH
ncbi:Aste57867_17286 [Aphanomyces stellatus]|uniref:Aste57867_17286 protein n=1 Tax=Aphanomyces stellatus TaxID=120398 RepID=A0A485L8C1_9STRA|nr:hypothetical protein As57867_017227 [Aphanomyces stellatus]VFT94042.1 Aste57867_17286 [Aphanomyces stellatus]